MSLQQEIIQREQPEIPIHAKQIAKHGQFSYCVGSDNEDDICDVMHKVRLTNKSAKIIMIDQNNQVDNSQVIKKRRVLKIDDNDQEDEEQGAYQQYDKMTQYSTSCSQISSSRANSTFSGQVEEFSLSAESENKLLLDYISTEDLTLEQIISDSKSGIPSLNEEKARQQKILKQRQQKNLKNTESIKQIIPVNPKTDGQSTQIDPKLVQEKIQYRTNSNAFNRKQHTKKWSDEETIRFFKGLQVFGTDFSLIQKLFPERTRAQIKNKFRKEEKDNSMKVEESILMNFKGRFNKIQSKLNEEKSKAPEITSETSVEDRVDYLQQQRKRRLNSFESIDSADIEIAEEVSQIFKREKTNVQMI